MPVLKMLVLNNASTEKCGTGICRYWKIPILERAGSLLKMPVLENVVKMLILENAGTRVSMRFFDWL